jgi:hypothetical protein
VEVVTIVLEGLQSLQMSRTMMRVTMAKKMTAMDKTISARVLAPSLRVAVVVTVVPPMEPQELEE